MIRGRLAIGGLTLEFGRDVQARFDELKGEVDRLGSAHTRLLNEERSVLEELATLYLPELTPEAVSAGLVELRDQLEGALEDQRRRLAALERQVPKAEAAVAHDERRVDRLEAEEARIADRLAERRALVEQALGDDDRYVEQRKEHAALTARIAELKARRNRLVAAANVERGRYERDPIFSYLRNRGFGEPGYRTGPVTSRLDRWLARRADFARLHRQYTILVEGPHAIQAEVRSLRARAEELEVLTDEREDEVGERLELLTVLEESAEAQRALERARDDLAQTRETRDDLRRRLRAVQARRGAPYEEAIAMQRDFLQGEPIQDLVRRARETASPKDDALVARLNDLRRRLDESGRELEAHRQELERVARKADRLDDVDRLVSRVFSSRRSYFPDDFDAGTAVRGALDEDATIEDVIRHFHEAHIARPLLAAGGVLESWFGQLSRAFDHELGVQTHRTDHTETHYIVYDAEGKVVHRRVTPPRRSD